MKRVTRLSRSVTNIRNLRVIGGMLRENKAIYSKTKRGIIIADFYGLLITSVGGVRYILVVVDNFTKFMKLYKLQNATMIMALRKLKMYFKEFGVQKSIYIDKGTQYTSKRWKQELREINVKLLLPSKTKETHVAIL